MNSNHTPTITLYSTSACHLCELAEQLIAAACPDHQVVIVEISEDETLLQQYGEKIPVLSRSDTNAELNWPFSESEIKSFLTK